jgi:hypothetical protein
MRCMRLGYFKIDSFSRNILEGCSHIHVGKMA